MTRLKQNRHKACQKTPPGYDRKSLDEFKASDRRLDMLLIDTMLEARSDPVRQKREGPDPDMIQFVCFWIVYIGIVFYLA